MNCDLFYCCEVLVTIKSSGAQCIQNENKLDSIKVSCMTLLNPLISR